MKKSTFMLLSIMLSLSLSGCNGDGTPPTDSQVPNDTGYASLTPAKVTNTPVPSGTPTQEAPSPVSVYVMPDLAQLEHNSPDGKAVYFTTDISPNGLMRVYQALGAKPEGKVAVKLSTGEPPNSNYLKPELIKDLVQSLDGTIVECNTAYGGQRDNNEYHLQVAKDHGFTDIANFDIMDSEGEISLPIIGGEILEENFVGSHFTDYDYFVVLSHFKGHEMAGYGGAIKNISVGIASRSGKFWIHSGGERKSYGVYGDQDNFLKSMAEAGKSIMESLNGNILYINVMNRLSIDCDCNGNPKKPDMHDVGIFASFDPVALDQACVDIVTADPNGESLMHRIEAQNGLLTLEHAVKMGLGIKEYNLVNIDD